MAEQIPQSHIWLLEKPVLAKLGTIMPDGRPQVHPVWSDWDGTYVRINTAAGRQKDKNLKERRYATILLIDPEDDHYWVEIRGHVAQRITGKEADNHIDKLSQDYTGREKYRRQNENEVRVLYKIEPDDVTTYGSSE